MQIYQNISQKVANNKKLPKQHLSSHVFLAAFIHQTIISTGGLNHFTQKAMKDESGVSNVF
jgi:hypothetical protein